MASILFEPNLGTFPWPAGESIFDVARRHGVVVSTSCVGRGTCGLCRVKITGGDEHLTPFGPVDRKHLGNVYFITKERLSCQARLLPTAPADAQIVAEIPRPVAEKLNP